MSHASTDNEVELVSTRTELSQDTNGAEHSDTETATAEELTPGLQEVHQDVNTMLMQINSDGEQIKEAVGRCYTSGSVDQEVAREIKTLLARQVQALNEEHDYVTITEIVVAFWTILHGSSKYVIGEADISHEKGEEADGEGDNADTGAEEDSGFGGFFGPNDVADGDTEEADPETEDSATTNLGFH